LAFEVSEETIARITRLPQTGKQCSKNTKVSRDDFKPFFKDEYQIVTGTKGYPEVWIKPEFYKPLAIIQKVIACAGRYSYFQAYHLRIFAHFENSQTINFPYFFYKSLEKMASQTRKNTSNPRSSLCHHGLVKLLVLDELYKQGRDWSEFLREVTLSQEHPPKEDVPLSVNTQSENPLPDVPLSANTQSEASLPDVPISPIENNPSPVREQTPVQEIQPRRSI